MALRLALPSINIGILSPNLKVGIVVGLSSVSALSAVSTFVVYSDEIKTQFNTISNFSIGIMEPVWNRVMGGAKNLWTRFDALNTMASSKFKEIYSWIQNNLTFEKWQKGFLNIVKQDWASLRNLAKTLLSRFSFDDFTFEKIRKQFGHLYEVLAAIKNLISKTFEIAFNPTLKKEIEGYFFEIIKTSKGALKFLKYVFGLISYFPGYVKQVKTEDIKRLMKNFLKNPDASYERYWKTVEDSKKQTLGNDEIQKRLLASSILEILKQMGKMVLKMVVENKETIQQKIHPQEGVKNSILTWFAEQVLPCDGEQKCNGTNTVKEMINVIEGTAKNYGILD